MRPVARVAVGVLVAASLAGCGAASAGEGAGSTTTTTAQGTSTTRPPSTSTTSTTTSPTTSTTTTTVPATRPLTGVVVGIDPGHNGRNWTDPAFIDRTIWNGTGPESCDTTGTATDGGYTEAQFNWNVATFARRDLEALGAHVVLTRSSNDGIGPCVTTRARRLDRAHVDVAFDVHADGALPSGRGFAILVPVADGVNDHVVTPSLRLARDLRATFHHGTTMPYSTYDGVDAIQRRSDLAGLNLTTVPKVLIECGNMRNATDAALLVTPTFQRRAALAIVAAVGAFLGRRLPR